MRPIRPRAGRAGCCPAGAPYELSNAVTATRPRNPRASAGVPSKGGNRPPASRSAARRRPLWPRAGVRRAGAPNGSGQPNYAPAHRPRRRGRRGFAIGPGCIFAASESWRADVRLPDHGLLVYDFYSGKLENEIDNLEQLIDYKSFETTIIYDRHGNELYEVFDEGRRTRITLDKVPQHVIDATIAIEDGTFYENRAWTFPASPAQRGSTSATATSSPAAARSPSR